MRDFVKFLLLSEAFAVATFGAGWWTVPVVAALWGFFAAPSSRQSLFVAACAAFGWACLLMLNVARGPVSSVAAQLGQVMRVPPFGLYLLTLIFPALLALTAATLVIAVRRSRAAP